MRSLPDAGVNPRYAIVWVPDWPIVAAGMEGLLDPSLPCAVHNGHGILVASLRARIAGVASGMRRRKAHYLCPDLTVIGSDEDRDARAFEAVVQSVELVAPFPTVLRPGLLALDAAGPTRHYGSEEIFANELVGAVAQESGSEAYVGIADGLLAAILAARSGVIVQPGHSTEFLERYPITTLRYAAFTKQRRMELDALADVLMRLGLTTLGRLAATPMADIAARFGEKGIAASCLAQGVALPVSAGRRPEGDVIVARELDPPIERADAAAFAARTLAEELATRLRARSCSRLHVVARTHDEGELTRIWTIDGPLAATAATDRVRWQLDGWLSGRSGRPPSAPLMGLELMAENVSGAGVAADPLWGRTGHSEVSARRAAVRLQGMLSPEDVSVPVLEGGRDPRTRIRMVAYGDDETPRRPVDAPWPGALPSPAPSILYHSPRQAQLYASDGRHVQVSARGHITADPVWIRVRVPIGDGYQDDDALIRAWAGPWPIHERWWETPSEGNPSGRAAWLQVAPVEGVALLLSTREGAWHVEGAYD